LGLLGFSFSGIEIAIGFEIDSFISAGYFSSIPIAIPISIWIIPTVPSMADLFKSNHNMQIPNHKQYPNTNVQNLKRNAEPLFGIWCLRFEIYLVFGA